MNFKFTRKSPLKISFYIILIFAFIISALFFYHSLLVKPKVLIIGLDGASWKFINPLINEHQLPNIEKLIKNAAIGEIQSFTPTKSSILWTSIATGKKMEKHGIVDWAYVDKKTKEKIERIQLITGNYKTAASLWEIMAKKGYNVGVINWWVTYPTIPINGFIISDRARNALIKESIFDEQDLIYPDNLKPELRNFLAKPKNYIPIMLQYGFEIYYPEKIEQYYSPSPFFTQLFPKIHMYVAQDKAVLDWSLYMLKKGQPDFFAVIFRITDVYAHLAWRFIEKQKLEKIVPEIFIDKIENADQNSLKKMNSLINELDLNFAKALLPAYKFADDAIGRILQQIEDNTYIIVVSDHGFQWNGGGYDHNPLVGHKYPAEPPPGILIIKGPDIKTMKIKKATLFDICPTILYALNEPIAKDMDGNPLKYIFQDSIFRKEKLIDTYGVGPINKKTAPSAAAEKEVLEDLKSLGYLR